MGPRISEIGERGLIRRLRETLPGLSLIGDDSAVLDALRCPVVSTDSFFEETHFFRWWASPDILGRRLLEASLSDLAAMGARPRWILTAVSLDPGMDIRWLEDFYRGLTEREEVAVAGGETVRGDRFGITITAIGEGGDRKTLLRRSALLPDDVLWVSGPVGRALDAPRHLKDVHGMRGDPLEPVSGEMNRSRLEQIRAFLRPGAELELGAHLRRSGVRCAIDISDGLLSEAAHLAAESRVDVVLNLEPSLFFESVKERPLEASAAGEDFVLLFGAGPEMDFTNRGCRRAGHAVRGSGSVSVYIGGNRMETLSTGYDHMEVDDG